MAWGYGDQPQLSVKWSLALCRFVGFTGKRLVTAVAVMWAESGRYPGAWHENLDPETGEVRSIDRGAFQINSVHDARLSPDAAFRPIPNAMYACELSNRGYHWSHWATYNSGRYLLFYPLVLAVWALRRWESRVPRVEAVLG